MAGRPSDYSEAIASAICDEIAAGCSLRQICEAEGMPNRSTVLRWLDAHADFAAKHARARELQADWLDEQMQEEATAATPEDVRVRDLRIKTMQWRAARLAPKRYGDKLELGGDIGINRLSDEQVEAKLAAMLAKTATAEQP